MARATTFAAAFAATLLAAADGRAADRPADPAHPGAASSGPRQAAMSAAEFVRRVAMTDLFEVEAGELAMRRGQHGEIKGYGQMLATDHQKSLQQLKELMKDQDVVPKSLDPDHATVVARLREMPEGEFDRSFVAMQIEAHDRAIALLERYAESGDDPKLRAFARESLTPNRHHLEIARRLARGYGEWKG